MPKPVGRKDHAMTAAQAKVLWGQYAKAGYNAQQLSLLVNISANTLKHRLLNAKRLLKVTEPAASRENRSSWNQLKPEQVIEAWKAYADARYNAQAAARSLRMATSTFKKRIEAARRMLGMVEVQAPEADARAVQKLRDQITRLAADLKKAHREANAAEDLQGHVFKLAQQPVNPPAWTLKAKTARTAPGIPMLVASDFQWGETIRAPELDGINEFNRDVARRRYKALIERTIDLACSHMVKPEYPGIVYWRLGDMISGDIHQELRETNDLQSLPAVLDLVEHEEAGIRELKRAFGRVYVVSVPGNHGRTTLKPFAKQLVETNYDYLSAVMLEKQFKSDPAIQFHTPLSGDAIVNIFGYRFLGTHGDRIGSSGGQGFIGPAATIARGMKKLSDYYSGLGQPIDYQLMGHFHTSLELEYGWSNGSLPGYGEFAKMFRMKPQPPSQWLLFTHPKYGVTCRWPILLEPRPRLTGAEVKAFNPER